MAMRRRLEASARRWGWGVRWMGSGGNGGGRSRPGGGHGGEWAALIMAMAKVAGGSTRWPRLHSNPRSSRRLSSASADHGRARFCRLTGRPRRLDSSSGRRGPPYHHESSRPADPRPPPSQRHVREPISRRRYPGGHGRKAPVGRSAIFAASGSLHAALRHSPPAPASVTPAAAARRTMPVAPCKREDRREENKREEEYAVGPIFLIIKSCWITAASSRRTKPIWIGSRRVIVRY